MLWIWRTPTQLHCSTCNRQVAPAELFRLLLRQIGCKARAGIYSARLVMWMMMIQRLQPRGTLASSVAQLVEGRFDPLLSRCKRVREKAHRVVDGRLLPSSAASAQTVGESHHGRTHRTVAEPSVGIWRGTFPENVFAGRIFLAVGARVGTGEGISPASNQHGKSHWPVVRIVVLHDLETGLAERPYWGPFKRPEGR